MYNVIGILFQSRQPFEMESQLDKKNEHDGYLFRLNQGQKAVKAARDICGVVYGDDFIIDRMA